MTSIGPHMHRDGGWMDVVTLEDSVGTHWFNREMGRKVGNGLKTSFWNDHWGW